MMMDDSGALVPDIICHVCHTLCTCPVLAENGKFCHKECICAEVENPIVIPSFIEKLIEDQNQIRDDSEIPKPKTSSELVRETKEKAKAGSASHMALLARWHLFGEQEGVDCDPTEGMNWCKKAIANRNSDAKAYQAICLLHGYGDDIEKNFDSGYEQLVESYHEESYFAAYKLGSYYLAGVHGFRRDHDNALKWLSRADSSRHLLTGLEQGNLSKYLNSTSGSSFNARPTGQL